MRTELLPEQQKPMLREAIAKGLLAAEPPREGFTWEMFEDGDEDRDWYLMLADAALAALGLVYVRQHCTYHGWLCHNPLDCDLVPTWRFRPPPPTARRSDS